MAGQIPGGADDAPDLAIAELSEETTLDCTLEALS